MSIATLIVGHYESAGPLKTLMKLPEWNLDTCVCPSRISFAVRNTTTFSSKQLAKQQAIQLVLVGLNSIFADLNGCL